MKEDFLQFIWQYQYFDAKQLQTTTGESVEIIDKGKWNLDSGADFQYAQILIDGIKWAGTVEIHLKASDWKQHAHDRNLAYQNVILHVVWEADTPIFRSDGTLLPTLELQKRVFGKALQQYHNLLMSPDTIPCAHQWLDVKHLAKVQMLDKALLQRLQRKAKAVGEMLKDNAGDWEETTYQVLAKHWGMKINQEPFGRLAQRLPLKVIAKHRDNLLQLEALFLGQAGFLEKVENPDSYTQSLQQEYHFLAQKYQLHDKRLSVVEWQFAKLRPANFPSLRLAQIAAFMQKFAHLFSYFLHTPLEEILKKPALPTSDYWQKHFNLSKPSTGKIPTLGITAWHNILINVGATILASYAQETQEEIFMEKALHLLQELPAEKNAILDIWESLNLKVNTAFDSQALIEQYNELCTKKKCLQCFIGASLLKNA
jgi:hypothetical protein